MPRAVRFFAFLSATCLALSLALLSSSAAADTPDRALELHDEARSLYAKGKYLEAVAKLKLAVELDPNAKVLYYNLGLIEEKLGHIDAALAYFRRCLELENSREERVGLAKTIKRLEGAKQYVDWEHNTESAPIIIRQGGGTTNQGETSSLLPWAYVAGGTAVVSAVVGIALAARAGAIDPGSTPTTTADTGIDQLQDDASEAHSLAIGADISFGIAAAALATTVVLALVSAHDLGGDDSAGELLIWRF